MWHFRTATDRFGVFATALAHRTVWCLVRALEYVEPVASLFASLFAAFLAHLHTYFDAASLVLALPLIGGSRWQPRGRMLRCPLCRTGCAGTQNLFPRCLASRCCYMPKLDEGWLQNIPCRRQMRCGGECRVP